MIQNYSHGLCIECNEGIFNPICTKCLAGQLDSWFNEAGISALVRKRIKESILNQEKKELPFEGIKCAVCKSSEASICPYCFTESIYNMLKKLEINKKLLGQFFTYFNYDFEHTGYSKDFEDM